MIVNKYILQTILSQFHAFLPKFINTATVSMNVYQEKCLVKINGTILFAWCIETSTTPPGIVMIDTMCSYMLKKIDLCMSKSNKYPSKTSQIFFSSITYLRF